MDLAVPIFTGVNLDPATLGRLSRVHNIVAIKEEAELNPKQITAFLNATPEDFIIYNGDDTMILEAYAQGSSARIGGVVSGAAQLVGPHIRKMIDTFLAGNIAEAAGMQRKLYPLLKVMAQNVPDCRKHGIEVCYVPDYGTEDVANHAIALHFAVHRHLLQYHRSVEQGRWDINEPDQATS
jgi:dihydrodipicolinate synthase/N-acetylneuraminate lyase